MQHLIIDGSPKWDIYRTVPVSSSSSRPPVASMPQASKAAPAERSAAAAPAKRDRLLEAATKGGVLLGSNDNAQVASLSLMQRMRLMLDLESGSCLHTRCCVISLRCVFGNCQLRLVCDRLWCPYSWCMCR